MNRENHVVQHYTSGELLDRSFSALQRAGIDPQRPPPRELAMVDEFHIGGAPATEAFASKLLFEAGARLLDVGCGLGGPARFFAQRFGAHVTGIDLTPEYAEVARRLSQITGQSQNTAFDVGSALAMPYADSSFDGAITVHVAMNIADRDGLYCEVARVLKAGATFGVYDVMKGSTEPLDYPVPWATTQETSHVLTQGQTRESLERTGFRVVEVDDRSAAAKRFFEELTKAAKAAGGPPPVGLHLLNGPTHAQKVANMLSAIADGRLAPAMIVAHKPYGSAFRHPLRGVTRGAGRARGVLRRRIGRKKPAGGGRRGLRGATPRDI